MLQKKILFRLCGGLLTLALLAGLTACAGLLPFADPFSSESRIPTPEPTATFAALPSIQAVTPPVSPEASTEPSPTVSQAAVTLAPTAAPTAAPTVAPTAVPTAQPTGQATESPKPTKAAPSPTATSAPEATATPKAPSTPAPTPVYLVAENIPVPERDPVGDDFFSDALFIGDSLTDGLFLYSGIRNATQLSNVGLSTHSLSSKECIEIDGKKYSVMNALPKLTFRKVYIQLGINEIGWPSPKTFRNGYEKLIDRIREVNPNAEIYVQSVLPITQKKNDDESTFTNEKINTFNALLRELCAERGMYFVNIAEAIGNVDGVLPSENSTDGIHLKSFVYKTWLAYLKTHTVA